ncbi:hypothetical protein Sru01_41700 [Sphaerisporangium rufum]|uniref:Secreted protein n=1 Tax=Sphaerisporangium rufum TaxID=1381558 RepID=A0A919R4K7_9ACTN|nr:hypothetical protein [Sphaerisporangium rufum]GII79188.1 hypothetical protein Sru01_41700 [Sphaerisporangium rufum]
MSVLVRRLAAGAAAAVLAAGLPAPAAAAAPGYHPSDADWADCPRLPKGATPDTWSCIFIITVGGTMRLGKIEQPLTAPLRITVAQGKTAGGGTAAAFGAVKGERMKVPGGLIGKPFEVPKLTDVYVETEGTGRIEAGPIFPTGVGIKIRMIHPLLGGKCYIGGDSRPIVLNPEIGSLDLTSIDGIAVFKATAKDDRFAVPKASGCGLNWGLVNSAVNLRAGLPSAAGQNSADLQWYVRGKSYTELPDLVS